MRFDGVPFPKAGGCWGASARVGGANSLDFKKKNLADKRSVGLVPSVDEEWAF